MDILLWILVGVVVVLLALYLMGRRALRPGVDPTTLTFDPALMARVQQQVDAGRKVQAIKELRDGTPGLGLATAKLMVDRMAAKQVPPPRPASDPVESPQFADDRVSSSAVPLELELEVRSLLSQQKVVEAVKLTRERTGWGLREAKNYVDGL